MTDIRKISWRFMKQSVCITFALYLIGLIIIRVCYIAEVFIPLAVSAVFSLVFSLADGMVWRLVATKGPDSLTTFYTAVSGFRMLLALATMFVYYLIVGQDSMLVFFLVFMIFYVFHLVHHAMFFAKVSNRMKCDDIKK